MSECITHKSKAKKLGVFVKTYPYRLLRYASRNAGRKSGRSSALCRIHIILKDGVFGGIPQFVP